MPAYFYLFGRPKLRAARAVKKLRGVKDALRKDAVAGPHHRLHVAVALAGAAQGVELAEGAALDPDHPLAHGVRLSLVADAVDIRQRSV
jgi:hypothetical protein